MKKKIMLIILIVLFLLLIVIGIASIFRKKENMSIYVDLKEKTVYIEEGNTGKKKKIYTITEEKMQAVKEKMLSYQKVIEKNIENYWPMEEEDIDITQISPIWKLEYTAEGEEETSYRYSGALSYPEDWDSFIKELKKIVKN